MRDVYAGAEPQVRKRIADHVLPVSRERVRLSVSAFDEDTTLLGAAELAFADLLANPLGVTSAAGAVA